MPDLLYADVLILCSKSEENLRTNVRFFVDVCRRGLKVNACKSKIMVFGGDEGLECEVYVEGVGLEHVSEFKYVGCSR